MKRREVKSKGEKGRYKHVNAQFQRIARRDKKAFFSNQRKEIEENNRMGKTRELFKKIRDTKGTRFSSYDGEFRMPLVLAQASPIFHSSCEGKLGIALE